LVLSGITGSRGVRFLSPHTPSVPIRACVGNDEEFSAVEAALPTTTSIILDPTALATIILLDALPLLEVIPFNVVVSMGTKMELMRFQSEVQTRVDATGFVGSDGESVWVQENVFQENDDLLSKVSALLSFIEGRCKVEEGKVLAGIPRDQREKLVECFGRAGAETIALTNAPAKLLWSDEVTQNLAKTLGLPIVRCWTQKLSAWLTSVGLIDPDTDASITIGLVKHGYTYTFPTLASFLKASALADWDPTKSPLLEMFDLIESSPIQNAGLSRILAGYIPRLWHEISIHEQAEQITLQILLRLSKRPGGFRIVLDLYQGVQRLFGLDIVNGKRCRDLIGAWLKSKPPLLG
jgi:hypothetical protein